VTWPHKMNWIASCGSRARCTEPLV